MHAILDDHELQAAGVRERVELPLRTPSHPGLTRRDYDRQQLIRAAVLGFLVLVGIGVAIGLVVIP